jgi:hypothetical protein
MTFVRSYELRELFASATLNNGLIAILAPRIQAKFF